MSSTARDDIFQALSKHAPAPRQDSAVIDLQARELLSSLDDIRPAPQQDSILDAFIERVSGPKVAASIEKIQSLDELPASVESLLLAQDRVPSICVQPNSELNSLDWLSARINQDGELNDGVSVSLARWGIAETGSVILHSGPDTPILLNMLPAITIIAVHASKLLWHLEDYATVAKASGEGTPRNACIITGASGTTDIEGSLVTGAHGPEKLHIVVIAD